VVGIRRHLEGGSEGLCFFHTRNDSIGALPLGHQRLEGVDR
jgi:hypothetical protein